MNLPGLNYSLEELDIRQFIINLLIGNTLGIYYFVFVLFYLYAVSLILRRIQKKWVFIMWIIVLVLTLYQVKNLFLHNYSLNVLFRHPCFHLLPYLTGWLFSLYYEKIISFIKNHHLVIFVIFGILDVTLFVFTRMDGNNFSSFPILTQLYIFICITLLIIAGMWTTKFQAGIQFVSNCSYGIYLLHFPFVQACQMVYPELSVDYSFVYAFVSWFAGIAGSILIIFIVQKLSGRYSRYLVGC